MYVPSWIGKNRDDHYVGITYALCSLTALAQGARMYNLTRPTMTDENIIDIESGW